MTPTPTLADQAPVERLGELLGIVAELREHCPWMGALTHESLVEYLLEEAFEVAETIETGADETELLGELGDVLLQVVLHARLAEELGTFTFEDVARGLSAKMVRRNPHVFRPDGTLQDSFPATVAEIVQKWDAVKSAERPERNSPFEGIPDALPALAKAQKSLDRASRSPTAPYPRKLGQGTLRSWAQARSPEAESLEPFETEEELGELLLAVVGSARAKGFDAERALRGAVRRYQAAYEGGAAPS